MKKRIDIPQLFLVLAIFCFFAGGLDKVFIYESSPTQHIVGWFSVSRVIKGHPDKIWKSCKDIGGIGKSRYYEYCNGNTKIYAFEIKEVHKFADPINPFAINTGFTPPQNFAYLDSSSIFFNSLDNEIISEEKTNLSAPTPA